MATSIINSNQLIRETKTVNSGAYGRASLGYYRGTSPVVSLVVTTLVSGNLVFADLSIYNDAYWAFFHLQDGTAVTNTNLEILVTSGVNGKL